MSLTEQDELRTALFTASAIDKNELLGEAIIEKIEPKYGSNNVLEHLHPSLKAALSKIGVSKLYSHQEEAIKLGLETKNNIVLQAPTASGKSLSFQVPVVNTLLNNSDAHGLFIYPMKALAFDQRIHLEKLNQQLSGQCTSGSYDGDTINEERERMRQKPPRIIFTNPEMLNGSFLGHHSLWEEFLSKLSWVVIDEMHEYRGYFGSNVSLLLRRFTHKIREFGIQPRYFLCSATCNNAKEHAELLTGLSFTEVKATNNFQPTRHYFFVQPNFPSDQNYWKSFQKRVVLTALTCANLGKKLIVFGPTRRFVEDCHFLSINKLKNRSYSLEPDNIKVYRSGLRPDERQQIQDCMNNGSAKIVYSTNALELGINISGLDGVILAGFPDTIMAAWQRIGRAGRSWSHRAFVIYLALNRPLDTFYANNLPTFLNKPLDELVVNHENEALAERHLPSLLHESTEVRNEDFILGETLGKLARGAQPVIGPYYVPHIQIPIRGVIGGMYKLMHKDEEIGQMSVAQQFREAYVGAIYLHGGKTYEVVNVTMGELNGKIALKKADSFLRTYPYIYTYLSVKGHHDGYQWNEFELMFGRVSTQEVLQTVRKENDLTGEILQQWTPVITSALNRKADSFWLKLRSSLSQFSEGLNSIQHMFRVGIQFIVPTDLHDIFPHAIVNESEVYIIESYPGGIGVAKVVLRKWREVLSKGLEIAEKCQCKAGCPTCILPPRTSEEFNKQKGIELANKLLILGEGRASHRYEKGIWKELQS